MAPKAGKLAGWTPEQMPDQSGRTALVTGPSEGGIGYFTALELARAGARVILAGRNPERLDASAGALTAELPSAEVERLRVDLGSFDSIRTAAANAARFGPIDVLINNAGVMAPPPSRSVDGLDLQWETNHYGPFLLTGLLLPQLAAGAGGRVVTVSSMMHKSARKPPLIDPRSTQGRFARWTTYGQTKLANLLFSYELDRRTDRAGLPVTALAAHPGVAGTRLVANGQFARSQNAAASALDAAMSAVFQPPHAGAWPSLMAATADLPGSTYVGPGGFREISGPARTVTSSGISHNRAAQSRLWELSEEITGIQYP